MFEMVVIISGAESRDDFHLLLSCSSVFSIIINSWLVTLKKFLFLFYRKRPKPHSTIHIWIICTFFLLGGQDSEKLSSRLLTEILTSKSPLATVYSIRQYSINSTLILTAVKTLLVTNLLNYNVNEVRMEKTLKIKKEHSSNLTLCG